MSTNDLGEKVTVEDCQRFPVEGLIKSFRAKSIGTILKAKVIVNGIRIYLTVTPAFFGGVRFWFLCPNCGKRLGVLLEHPTTGKVGCRKCLQVHYRNQTFKGMIEELILK